MEGGKDPEPNNNLRYFGVEILCAAFTVLCALVAMIRDSCESNCWNFLFTAAWAFALGGIITELNRQDAFHAFAKWLDSLNVYSVAGRNVFLILFLCISVLDFILLAVSNKCDPDDTDCDEPMLDPDANAGAVRIITRTLTTVAGLLSGLTVVAWWDLFSYYTASFHWFHSFLYCTVAGGVALEIARYLKPPPEDSKDNPYSWSWHDYHPYSKIWDGMMVIICVIHTMFVLLQVFLLIGFSEISKASSDNFGVSVSIIVFSILGLLGGITPLMPGSVIDCTGGFLVPQVLVVKGGYDLPAAFLITLGLITALHFVGSCLQYFMGKMKCVQNWSNFILPADMLAASDTVLKEANCIEVGLVGQVFMDTANGLNQGRMNMNFCTQFWSEYASMPSGIAWCAVGTSLSIPTLGTTKYDWASEAAPILILVALIWQVIASGYGANQLLSAGKKIQYFHSKTKWETVQHFYSEGYRGTKKGWDEDIFQVKNIWKKLQIVHDDYVEKSEDLREKNLQLLERVAAKDYSLKMKEQTKELWATVERDLAERVSSGENELVLEVPKEEQEYENLFYQAEGNMLYFQAIIVWASLFLALASYYYVASEVETKNAVLERSDLLTKVKSEGWIAFCLYHLFLAIYYQREMWNQVKGIKSTCESLFCAGCAVDQTVETEFNHAPYVAQMDGQFEAPN